MSFIRKALGASAFVGIVTLWSLAYGPGFIIAGATGIAAIKLIEKLSGNRGPFGLTEEEFEQFRNLKELLDLTDGI